MPITPLSPKSFQQDLLEKFKTNPLFDIRSLHGHTTHERHVTQYQLLIERNEHPEHYDRSTLFDGVTPGYY